MISPTTISEYIKRQIAAFNKIALRDFIIELQAQFYSDQDISFMDYFLELSQEENQGQFVVHHEKLIEYGVCVATGGSADVKKSLNKLRLSENVDFTLLRNVSEQKKTGSGGSNKKVYMLTPDSFKLALMRASEHKTHSVNADKYARYYLFLEAVVGYYMKYQLGIERAMSVAKDGTIQQQTERIDTLISEVRDLRTINIGQSTNIEKLTQINVDQSANIETLMCYAQDTNATIHALDQSHTRKSQLSTVSLINKNLENYYGSTMMIIYDQDGAPYVRVQNNRCQRKDLIPKMKNLIEGTYTTNKNIPVRGNHCIAIPPIYFPNAVTLLIKVVERFEKIVRKQKISEFNREFKDEIKSGDVERLTIKNFPVKMTRLYFEYHPNNVMTFHEVIMIVVNLIKQSQGCAIDLPATQQLQMLSDKQQAIIEKRFLDDGFAAQEELLKEVNKDIAEASRDLTENIFKGVFETQGSSESN